MKKLLFIIVAVFSVLVFKPTAEGALLSVVDGIEDGYIIDTTDEEMEVISNSRSLLTPAVRTFSGLSLVNNTGKNTTNHYCKSLHSKHSETALNIINRGRVNVLLPYKLVSHPINYYIFSLRRIRI